MKNDAMTTETIVAVYDTPAHAELALNDLRQAGIPTNSIQHYTSEHFDRDSYDPARTTTEKKGGLWEWLFGDDETTTHHQQYDRSLQSGETVVTVIAEQANAARVISILEDHAPLDIDERQGTYQGSGAYDQAAGRSGTDAIDAGIAGSGFAQSGMTQSNMAASGRVQPGLAEANTTYGSAAATTGAAQGVLAGGNAGIGSNAMSRSREDAEGEQVIPLSEENLQVGKREVDRGTTRVRRYVVERPVEEQIRLRDEHVAVFRRPASGIGAGADAFTDRTIEVTERAEEAVVSKSAHVAEEVVVQKRVDERNETVRDTLRKEEVEITGGREGQDLTRTDRSV